MTAPVVAPTSDNSPLDSSPVIISDSDLKKIEKDPLPLPPPLPAPLPEPTPEEIIPEEDLATVEENYTPWDKTENNKPQIVKEGNTGAFGYSYPIKTPPMRKDVIDFSPSLNYNSQNTTDSVLGYGWDMTIPSIERINKTGT